MKRLLPIFINLIFIASVSAQDNIKLTQFYQAPQLFNPAFTGAEGFLDIKLGRKQNFGANEIAPKTSFLSVNGSFKGVNGRSSELYSLRISNPGIYDELSKSSGSKVNHGLGGFVLAENQGAFSQERITLSYSFQYILKEGLNLSIGLAPSISRSRVDVNKIRLENPEDPTYNGYLANEDLNTQFKLGGGALIYAQKYYLGYSLMQFYKAGISSNQQLNSSVDQVGNGIIQNVMAGYNFGFNDLLEFQPSLLVSYRPSLPLVYNVNAKFRYQQRFMGGISYQNSGSVSLLAGILFNDKLSLGYSYDHTIKGISNYVSGSHELVLGLMLFGNEFSKPHLW